MEIKVFNNKENIQLLKVDWEMLFDKGNYSFFQSFTYCYNSILKQSKPFIICYYEDGKLVEIWPLELKKNKLIFINDTHADFCDIISETDSLTIINFLKENKLASQLRLKNLKKDSITIKKTGSIKVKDVSFILNYSLLKLEKSDNFPSNFNHFVYRQKRRLKRILKKYNHKTVLYEIESSKFPIQKIKKLRKQMIELEFRNNNFLDEDLISLIEKLYTSGSLIVNEVVVDNNTTAISFIFKKNYYYSFWIDLFNDQKMMNLVNNTAFIKEITKENSASFNFGRGDYSYKIKNFGPEVIPLFELNTYSTEVEKYLSLFLKSVQLVLKKLYKKFR
jgi:hypothetical protein